MHPTHTVARPRVSPIRRISHLAWLAVRGVLSILGAIVLIMFLYSVWQSIAAAYSP